MAPTHVAEKATAAPYRCKDVLVLGARGSGERRKDDLAGLPWFGRRAGGVAKALVTDLGQRDVDPEGLNVDQYPAYDVKKLVGDFTASGPYFQGLSAGVRSAKTILKSQAAACPHEVFVLTGYSQGAMVMHRVMVDLADAGRHDILDRIAAAVLIGDGDRHRNSVAAYLVGEPSAGAEGKGIASLFKQRADIPGRVAGRTWEICTKSDLVCDNRLSLVDLAGLTWWGFTHEADRIAKIVNDGIRVHQGDTYLPRSKVITKAATQAANIVMGWPKPKPVSRDLSADAGTPISIQLHLSVRANMADKVRWVHVANLPPGLTLSKTGLITGTPTQSGHWATTYDVRSAATGIFSLPIPGEITWNVSTDSSQFSVTSIVRASGPAGLSSLFTTSGCPEPDVGDAMWLVITDPDGQEDYRELTQYPNAGWPNWAYDPPTDPGPYPELRTFTVDCREAPDDGSPLPRADAVVEAKATFDQTILGPGSQAILSASSALPGDEVTFSDGGGCGSYPGHVQTAQLQWGGDPAPTQEAVDESGRWQPWTFAIPADASGDFYVYAECWADDDTYVSEGYATIHVN